MTVTPVESKAAVPKVVLKVNVPLMSVVSANVTEPLAALVPMVTLLNVLPAEVSVVVPSKIQVEPVLVKVSALVRFNAAPA